MQPYTLMVIIAGIDMHSSLPRQLPSLRHSISVSPIADRVLGRQLQLDAVTM
jgi:hypothetical protein